MADLDPNNLPRQVSSGIVRIGDIEVEVVQLDNGLRLITQESMTKLMGADLLTGFVDVLNTHSMTALPHSRGSSIVELKCACGWLAKIDLADFASSDDAFAEASKIHLAHVAEDQALA